MQMYEEDVLSLRCTVILYFSNLLRLNIFSLQRLHLSIWNIKKW